MGNSASGTQQSVVTLRAHLEDLEDRLAELSFDVKLREKERTVQEQHRPLVPPPTRYVLPMHGATLQCVPGVRITVGPVVGKVSSTTATVLLEVDTACDVTMHACTTDTQHPYGLVMSSVTRSMPANEPRAFHFTGLAPGYRFHAVTSGVARVDAQVRVGRFTTVDPTAATTRIAVVSHNVVAEEERGVMVGATGGLNMWQRVAKSVEAGDVDVVLHIGSQVNLTPLVRDAYHWVRRHAAAGCLAHRESRAYRDLEAALLRKFRDAYRRGWNHPTARKALARCSNLMMWGEHDVCANFTDMGGLLEVETKAAAELRQHVIPDPNSADATIRTLLRLAHKVFREYQRQLYDPAFADIGSMDEAELQRQREALQGEWRRVLDAGKKAEVTAREKRELAFQADDTIDRLKATHAALDAQHGKPSAKTVQRRETNLARLRRKAKVLHLESEAKSTEAMRLSEALLERAVALDEVNQLGSEQHWHTIAPNTAVFFLDLKGNRITPDGALALNKPLIGSRQWSLLSTALAQEHIQWLIVATDSPLVDAAAVTLPDDTQPTAGTALSDAAARRLQDEFQHPSDRLARQLSDQPTTEEDGAVRSGLRVHIGTPDGDDDERSWHVARRQRQADEGARLMVVRALAEWKAQVPGRQLLIVHGGLGCAVRTLVTAPSVTPAPLQTGSEAQAPAADPAAATDVQFPQLCVGPLAGAVRRFASPLNGHKAWPSGDAGGDAGGGASMVASGQGIDYSHRPLDPGHNYLVLTVTHDGRRRSKAPPSTVLHGWHGPVEHDDSSADLILESSGVPPPFDSADGGSGVAADATEVGTGEEKGEAVNGGESGEASSKEDEEGDESKGSEDNGEEMDPDTLAYATAVARKVLTPASDAALTVPEAPRLHCRIVSQQHELTDALLGPVIGKVTSSSAVILFEVSTRSVVKCTLTDCVTLQSHSQTRMMPGRRPATFHFNALLPQHRYEISFSGIRCAGDRTGSLTTLPTSLDDGLRVLAVSSDEGSMRSVPVSPLTQVDPKRDGFGEVVKGQTVPATPVDVWKDISDAVTAPWNSPHVVVRLGGQVDAASGFGAAMAALRQFEARYRRPWQSMRGAQRAAAINAARDAIRDVYREQWNLPHIKTVLAHCPHLMAIGDSDIEAGITSNPLPRQGPSGHLVAPDERSKHLPGGSGSGSSTVAASHGGAAVLLRRLAREVFVEYQRQLWDPNPDQHSGGGMESGVVGLASAAGTNGEQWHYHRWGSAGLFITDCVTNKHDMHGSQGWREPLTPSQWRHLERVVSDPSLRTLCIATAFVPLITAPHDILRRPTDTALEDKLWTDSGWAAFPKLTERFLRLMFGFMAASAGREVVLMGSGLRCGLSTLLHGSGLKTGRTFGMRQLGIGPMLAPPRRIACPHDGRIAFDPSDFYLGARGAGTRVGLGPTAQPLHAGLAALMDGTFGDVVDADESATPGGADASDPRHVRVTKWGQLDVTTPSLYFKHVTVLPKRCVGVVVLRSEPLVEPDAMAEEATKQRLRANDGDAKADEGGAKEADAGDDGVESDQGEAKQQDAARGDGPAFIYNDDERPGVGKPDDLLPGQASEAFLVKVAPDMANVLSRSFFHKPAHASRELRGLHDGSADLAEAEARVTTTLREWRFSDAVDGAMKEYGAAGFIAVEDARAAFGLLFDRLLPAGARFTLQRPLPLMLAKALATTTAAAATGEGDDNGDAATGKGLDRNTFAMFVRSALVLAAKSFAVAARPIADGAVQGAEA